MQQIYRRTPMQNLEIDFNSSGVYFPMLIRDVL